MKDPNRLVVGSKLQIMLPLIYGVFLKTLLNTHTIFQPHSILLWIIIFGLTNKKELVV